MSEFMAFCCLKQNKKPAAIGPVKKPQILPEDKKSQSWELAEADKSKDSGGSPLRDSVVNLGAPETAFNGEEHQRLMVPGAAGTAS